MAYQMRPGAWAHVMEQLRQRERDEIRRRMNELYHYLAKLTTEKGTEATGQEDPGTVRAVLDEMRAQDVLRN